jgi:hypothetical protein
MYLYLHPCGGFNDILCGILEMSVYCKKYNRTLLVGGTTSIYKVNFAKYFDFSGAEIICDEIRIAEICNTIESVYPTPLKGRVSDIITGKLPIHYAKGAGPESGATTHYAYGYFGGIFDLPSCEREEQLIVYVRSGGGIGYTIFKTLRIHPDVKSECKRRYDQLEKPYICLYIRNTDYKCDYASLYNTNREEITSFKERYIATDDKGAIGFFGREGIEVKNFTTFPSIKNYHSLHKSVIKTHTKMMDLLCDIYLCAMSSKLLSNSTGGFACLVKRCHANQKAVEEQFRI